MKSLPGKDGPEQWICETLILVEEEPKRLEGNRTACIQDLMRLGSDPVSVYQLVSNTKLIRGFSQAEDAVQPFDFLLDRLGAHKFIFKQDQNITGGGSHTTNLL